MLHWHTFYFFLVNLIFVWPCIINVGKVIQKNQLDATIIYWSIRSAQHVSGNFWPSSGAWDRFLQHMVTCCCGGQGRHHNNRLPYAVKISVSRSWWWAKDCPKHVGLNWKINKLLLHLVGSSVLLYLHWWCTVKQKSNTQLVSKWKPVIQLYFW